MKKILSLGAVLGVMAFFMTSCSKDYQCTCYENGLERYTYSLTEKSDKEADTQCALKATTLGSGFQCAVK